MLSKHVFALEGRKIILLGIRHGASHQLYEEAQKEIDDAVVDGFHVVYEKSRRTVGIGRSGRKLQYPDSAVSIDAWIAIRHEGNRFGSLFHRALRGVVGKGRPFTIDDRNQIIFQRVRDARSGQNFFFLCEEDHLTGLLSLFHAERWKEESAFLRFGGQAT